MDLFIYLSYDFINKHTVGITKKNTGNNEFFLYLKINIGKIMTKRNTTFIEEAPIKENPCINTSLDEKKFPGLSQGKYNSLPRKYSKIDKIIKVLIWISPIFDETNFEIMKAKHQIKDNNDGSNATAIGIKIK